MTTTVCRYKPQKHLELSRRIGERNAHMFRGIMKLDPDTMEATAPDGSRRPVSADEIEIATSVESDGRLLTAHFGEAGWLSIYRPYWFKD